MRSRTGFDCIPLAESLGGGGHAQACGCKMPHARLAELLSGTFGPTRWRSTPKSLRRRWCAMHRANWFAPFTKNKSVYR